MSFTFGYDTTEPVEPGVREAILVDAEKVNAGRNWWRSAIRLGEWKRKPGHLAGASDLVLGSYTDSNGEWIQFDVDEEQFMAGRDADFIIEQLERWSREHGVSWTLSMDGEEMCVLANGKLDPESRDMIRSLFEPTDPDSSNLVTTIADPEERAAAILEKYPQKPVPRI